LGDIGQPLHTSVEARGGNDFHCLWKGKQTNLHLVWDDKILDTTINGKFNAYVNSLETAIRIGKYAKEKNLTGLDASTIPKVPISTLVLFPG
jgi:hypothetical protein